MQYLVCEKPGHFALREKPHPVWQPGEALLKVKQVGICGTDLHAYAGNQPFFTYPRILGHELAVEIEEIDPNERGLKVGDRAIVMPYLSCGHCIACRNGQTNCCTQLKVLGVHTDGGMQERITLPIGTLLPADGLSDDAIAVVEPLAIGAHALRRAAVQPEEWVLVIGCGPIGIGLIKLAQGSGARVIALDVDAKRLDFVKTKLGVTDTVQAGAQALEAIRDLTGGDLARAVFDATGNKTALESGVQYMSHGGRYVLVGLSKGTLSFEHPVIHSKELSLLCSRNATVADFQQVKAVLQSGQFPVDAYITHRVPFAEMMERFESWLLPETGVIKAMVVARE